MLIDIHAHACPRPVPFVREPRTAEQVIGGFAPNGSVSEPRPPTGPIEEHGAVPQLLRCYPNLYGDLSDLDPWNASPRAPSAL